MPAYAEMSVVMWAAQSAAEYAWSTKSTAPSSTTTRSGLSAPIAVCTAAASSADGSAPSSPRYAPELMPKLAASTTCTPADASPCHAEMPHTATEPDTHVTVTVCTSSVPRLMVVFAVAQAGASVETLCVVPPSTRHAKLSPPMNVTCHRSADEPSTLHVTVPAPLASSAR